MNATLLAQLPGDHDASFNPGDMGFGAGVGYNGFPYAVVAQANGGILLGGQFTRFNTVARSNLVRLLPDGTVDDAFLPPTSNAVRQVVEQPDGKILVVNGAVQRLLSNGTYDPSFNNMACCDAEQILLQPDGRIVVYTTSFPGLVRILSNGDLDPSFSFAFPGAFISTMALQPDGRILLQTDVSPQLIRLNSDGSVDPTFSSGPGPSPSGIGNILVQPDGRILVTGTFNTFNGVQRERIVRLESTGSVDLSFDAGPASGTGPYQTIALRPDGRILIGGSFTSVQGASRPGLAQLLSNGTLDPTFQVGSGFNPVGPTRMVLDMAGRVLCTGLFTGYAGELRRHLARVLPNGSVDADFHRHTGLNNQVNDLLLLSDGRITVAGDFTGANGRPRGGLARFMPDGTLDTTYVPVAIENTRRIVAQSSGKVVVMRQPLGSATYLVQRMNLDGSLDGSFTTGSGFTGAITDMDRDASDRLLVCGQFTSVDGNTVGRIARLLPDGQFDPTFTTGTGLNGTAWCVLVQPDGKVLVGGSFYQYNGTTTARLIRLNSDGSLDPSFASALIATHVGRLALLPDGRILTAHNYGYLSCLLPSGALDPTFNNGLYFGSSIEAIAASAAGGIVVSGNFVGPAGYGWSGIALLTAIGQPDAGFDPGAGLQYPGTGFTSIGYCLAVQPDGRVLVGGRFTAYDGTGRNFLARLFGGQADPLLLDVRVHLGGSFESGTGLMRDQLRTAGLIPVTEPYTGLGYVHVGGGGEQATAGIFTTTGPDAIVDWVVVELRDPGSPATVLAAQCGLVQRDGDVISADGAPELEFGFSSGNYHVAIRHRNHLACMSAAPIALSSTSAAIDFTLPSTPTWGTNARQLVNGTMVLWPGDATFDSVVKYAGAANDRDAILGAVGGGTPTNAVNNVYDRRDV
ncbi:MAG TPA: delta-60 repeat domain-containing protein, partial [Flavobacteriales bacterium]|nr:delta-60 repeat domain-containing protein [Flavobacteriales bacterium]HMR29257.1 delta-60 repeat domain-containing protein [Flavobacteriales bacterium]